jgi:SHS2 domain-containing protein
MDSSGFYRVFDHTADVGIEVDAGDRAGVFTRSALAMFDLMFGLETIGRTCERKIEARADTLSELLVAWLNEVLYVHAAERLVFSEFVDARLADGVFSARGLGEKLDPATHAGSTEIKAATYHNLRFEQAGDKWTARIIFDV